MTTITFDTHKFVRKLKESGLPEGQAEAIADAFQEAQGEAEIATKTDIREVKTEIEFLRRDMREMEQRMVIKLGGLIVLAVGVVATLDKIL